MRIASLALTCALLPACFSKPPNHTGDGDGGGDSSIDGPTIDPAAPLRIATGGKHACTITPETGLLCWGNHDHGQLGDRTLGGTLDWSGTPAPASPETGWTSIAAGEQHTCGVRNGTVYCWGENNFGQSAPGNSASNVGISPVSIRGTAAQVFAGGFTTCAINTEREAYCWGQIDFRVAATLPDMPMRLGATTFTAIAIADDHACGLEDGGRVWCWGEVEQRQTGQPSDPGDMDVLFGTPLAIAAPTLFKSISAGHEATCGATVEGKLACWGTVNHGQLGDITTGPQAFRIVDETRQWTRTAVGYDHVCAVSDGDVYCYGDNYLGALGSGQFASKRTIGTKVAVDLPVSQVAANDSYSCALNADGTALRCWGTNSKGELGNKKASRKLVPTEAQLPAGSTVAQLVAGDHHTCALVGTSAPYTAYCWGLNDRRQIGSNSTIAIHAIPVPASSSTFTKLTAGEKHTCGIVDTGANIECWGDNSEYQLSGTMISSRTQVATPTMTSSWTYVAAGSRWTCGIHLGDLHCWGTRPGANASPSLFAYPRLGGSPGWPWQSISLGSGFAVGVASNGSTFHLAGIGAMETRCAAGLVDAAMPANSDPNNTPVEILAGLQLGAMLPLVSSAQAGGAHTCVHRDGGTPTVTCFGNPALPQVGEVDVPSLVCGERDNNSTDVGGPWVDLNPMRPRMFATADQTCALDSGSRLKCWGTPSNFELGTSLGGPTPDQIFPAHQWRAIAGGDDHTCGIDLSDGKVYCWGENQYGQVGDGTSYEPSPVDSGAL